MSCVLISACNVIMEAPLSEELKLSNEEIQKKINLKLMESLKSYRNTLSYMAADVPLEAMCLPKPIETALRNEGCLRVYDLLDRDLGEIKGIGKLRGERLAASLNEFLAMG